MKKTFSAFLDLLYPGRCPLCDGLRKKNEPLICRGCAEKLAFLKEPLCCRCGRPLERSGQEYCKSCAGTGHRYIRGFAPFLYRGAMQESLMRFKYGGRAEYAGFYAAALLQYGRRHLERWKPDILLPVPLHRSRLALRGYNQAEEVARELSALCGIPVDSGSVIRKKKTRAQKELSGAERRKNLEHAFALAGKKSAPAGKILIIDDIYTTGSTVDALAGLLLENGAEAVYFACVTVSPGDSF
jgi:ComF family protein